ncbi:MAG: HD domain-containing protein [Treponema sp.]|jgi:HD-GYP domain-containing protein (c-di-GMP phosphodiesterase class II)|nr:HD domain-containing protein [Treponema sp.]
MVTVRMDSLIKSIATALDIVEGGLLGASTNHGKRIAVLCAKMGTVLGKNPDEITALAVCALLHDNALTEYILSERMDGDHDSAMKKHCEFGQRNVDALRFKTNVKDFILYHHERADGTGPFGIREGEGPLEAELITIADSIDVACHLQRLEPEELPVIRNIIVQETGKHFSKKAAETLLEILDRPALLSLKDNVIKQTASDVLFPWTVDIQAETIFGLAGFIARIIDYKSVFTEKHSTQIANKAWFMGKYYRYDPEKLMELYLAASLHDLGKLAVPPDILEKPGKLSGEEFEIIKKHIHLTWELLNDIEGFESICQWAANHHEKLDGSGYPFGKKAPELDFNSRLLACLDIYQAISEERPYHPGRNHGDTMQILHEMADMGKIDGDITKDLDIALAPYDGKDLPPPNSCGAEKQ